MRKLLLPLALLAPLLLPLFATPANAACTGGTVTACGADPTGKKDSTTAFAAAIAATPSGGTLTIPAGTYALSSNLSVTKPITINCSGTIKPFSNPAGPIPFFLVTAAPFTFDGHNGACVFDGVSAATNNFITAVNVAGPNDFIGPAKVTGIRIKNMALNETQAPYEGITMTAVKNCIISNNSIENSGPNKSYAGGFAIYLQYTAGCTVSGNSGDHIGSVFINDSSSVGNTMSGNKVSYVTLFAFKGGYGTGLQVTGHGQPGVNAFTVGDGNYARSSLTNGKYFNILHGGSEDIEGTVDHYVVGAGFLTIFMRTPLAYAPAVGDEIRPLSTAMKYIGNSCTQTGDNCYDINGWHDMTITNQTCDHAGEYQPTGATFGGLATCIWLGYDPAEPAGTYRGIMARISGTVADHVGGDGIMVTEGVSNVIIDNYKLTNINERNFGGDEGCGIALNPLNENPNSRGSDMHIGKGVITGSTPNACLAWIENSTGDTINGLTGTATNGIMIDAGGNDSVVNTTITVTGTADGTYAYNIGPGGGQHELGVAYRNNHATMTAPGWPPGHGYGFTNNSPANSGIDVDASNSVTAPNAPRGAFVPRIGF